MDLLDVLDRARTFLHNRRFDDEGEDGLDAGRQALRWLRTCNLPDTRLILCSMEGDVAFPDMMRMLTEPEFLDMHHRVLVTTEPELPGALGERAAGRLLPAPLHASRPSVNE